MQVRETLSAFLLKTYHEKFGALQRMVAACREKVTWCEPEHSSDKYNLEVKLASLLNVEANIQECDAKKHETDTSLKLFEKVESPENLKTLKDEREKVHVDLEALKLCFIHIKQILQKNIVTWHRYEAMLDSVLSQLKPAEAKLKEENAALFSPNQIEDKIKDMVEFNKLTSVNKRQMLELVSFSKDVTEVSININASFIEKL